MPWQEWPHGPRFGSRYRALTDRGGGSRGGVAVVELPPGKQSCPAHHHLLEEEHLLFLEGRATLRLGDRTHEIGPGEHVRFPAGRKAAHRLANHGAAPCRFLIIGERDPNDIVVYPDSRKVKVRLLGENYRPRRRWTTGKERARTGSSAGTGRPRAKPLALSIRGCRGTRTKMGDRAMAEGGCLCGAVRYRLEGPPLNADFCHCRMCQRAAGAPVVAWGTWPADRFAWTRGEPRSFASSAKGERSFCPTCGTPLTFVDPGERTRVDVTLASLDDPAAFPPGSHAWTMSRVPWLEIGDELPRYASTKSGGEGGGA